MQADTIAAVASPPGAAARGVLRLSGERAGAILGELWRGPGTLAPARRACFEGLLHDGLGLQPALVLWMPAPRSYTREDVCELHVSGSPFLLEALLARVLALGARLAEPGEFTRRAFLSGRLDLAQAHGVLALVRARDEDERRAASARLFGGLARRAAALGETLDDARAACEASLDFEEADTGDVPRAELRARVAEARAAARALEAEEQARPTPSGAPRVVLAGRPNAGKSSLFNALVDSPRALVSALAGTTRDALVGSWRAEGRTLALRDTAGLLEGLARPPDAREGAPVQRPELAALAALERAAEQRARAELESADLIVWVVDASAPAAHAADAGEQLARELARLPRATPRVVAWAQADRAQAAAAPRAPAEAELVVLSARTGHGLDALARAVRERLAASAAEPGSERALGLRHREALRRAAERLDEALAVLEGGAPLDQLASLLREASDELGAIDGRTSPEELLGRIFARFCIGK